MDHIGAIDVKAAFLQAPRRTQMTRVTVGEPPSLLKAMNLVKPDEKWIIKQALYGLIESPGDWGQHRDEQLPHLRWRHAGQEFTLKETKERHVWAVRRVGAPETEDNHGFVLVYVDDMLLFGDTEQVKATAAAVRSLWECSPLELLDETKELHFCGMELRRYKSGVFLSQTGYLVEMLKRYEVQGVEPYPLPKVEDGEDEEPYLKALRRAQTLVGELLWASTRTRPDIAFATGLLDRLAHRRPNYVNTLGEHLLKYLQGTTDYGLNYQPGDDTDYGDGQLPDL